MIDVNPLIISTLNTIGLPVLLETKFDADSPIPCITAIEFSNKDTLTGDTLEYSEIIIMIKVWSDDMAVLMSNSMLIDTKIKALGFKRDFGSTLFGTGTGQYILRYKGTGVQNK